MCGIAGIINNQSNIDLYKIMGEMLNTIQHRGPDGYGITMLENENNVFGHVRLSIIDLSNYASQPFESNDGCYSIIYNGELYNYKELRKQLAQKGHLFRSKSDTEVVLESYIEWGTDCLNKFNGMFAFAIWDGINRNFFLARDRYGIKPLYYAKFNGAFIFASEQKAILKYPSFSKEIDPIAIKEYFTFQNILSNRTFFENIKILPPGTYLYEKMESIGHAKIRKYWDYNFTEPEVKCSLQDYADELNMLFTQSVKRQLASDVEIGSYLSGGMDSGSITAIASREKRRLKTFTCGFDLHSASGIEMAYDERSKSEFMSYKFGTEHYEVVLKAGDMEDCMRELMWSIEEPRVGQSYPNYYVSRLASKFVKVVLSGAGGDELFGGYPWRYYRSVNNETFDEYVDKYYEFWQRLTTPQILDELLKPLGKDVESFCPRDAFIEVFKDVDHQNVSPEQCVNNSMYFEAKTFLHGLLIVEDKVSMASGLETRVPFLDNDLVEFAMKIPVDMKLSKLQEVIRINENDPGHKIERYYQRTKDGKRLLRESMKKIIPFEIANAEKQGFTPPDNAWFHGESIDYIKKITLNHNARMYNYINKETVQRLVEEHITGKKNWRLFVWSVLAFNQWCELFL